MTTRVIPAIGLIGAPRFLLAGAATIVGANAPGSVWTALATLPIFVWEASLGVWLTVKEVKPDALRRLHTPGRNIPANRMPGAATHGATVSPHGVAVLSTRCIHAAVCPNVPTRGATR